jgi:hypothetical protein
MPSIYDDSYPGRQHHRTAPPSRSRMPAILSAPLDSRAWRALLHSALSVPISALAFTYVIASISLGASLAITFLGIPLLAGLLCGASGFGALERARAGALLGTETTPPAARRPHGDGLWAWCLGSLADGASWRAFLYMLLLMPWAIFSFTVSAVFMGVGFSLLLYPAWQWVFPRFADEPGIQLWGNPMDTGPEIWFTAGVGLVVVMIWPWVARGLSTVDSVLVRGLLGRPAEYRI